MADPAWSRNPEQLLGDIIALKAKAKEIEEQLSAALGHLTHLVDEAEIDQSFKFDDWSFSCTSRTSYDYPQEVKAIDGALKAAKRAAEGNGSAIAKIGAPFWTIKSPKA